MLAVLQLHQATVHSLKLRKNSFHVTLKSLIHSDSVIKLHIYEVAVIK